MKQAIGGWIVGGGLFALGFVQFRKSRSMASWPSAPGQVVQATVETTYSRGDEDTADSYTYSPAVVYQYQVNGQTFHGTRITYVGKGYDRPEKAQAALAQYPVGLIVNVYFNPAKPQDSVLVPGKTAGVLLMAVGALIVAAAMAA